MATRLLLRTHRRTKLATAGAGNLVFLCIGTLAYTHEDTVFAPIQKEKMALFGKKKGESAEKKVAHSNSNTNQAEPQVAQQRDDGAFDFDAIARDLDAQNGPSSFDALLSQPAEEQASDDDPFAVGPSTPVPPMSANTGSAFDFPEDVSALPEQNSPLLDQRGAFEINDSFGPSGPVQSDATSAAKPTAELDDLDAIFAEPAPSAPAPVTPTQNAPVHAASLPPIMQTPATAAAALPESPKAKKPFPLVPALLALGILGAAGLAGWHFTKPSQEEPVSLAVVSPTPQATNEAEGIVPEGIVPEGIVPEGIVPEGIVPEVTAVPLSTAIPRNALNTATPGGATITNATPAAVTTLRTTKTTNTTSQTTASPAQATTSGPVSPEILAQLKALWEQGRDAKARGDYASARQFWQEALRIRPGHPGFQESIDKLPAATGASALVSPASAP